MHSRPALLVALGALSGCATSAESSEPETPGSASPTARELTATRLDSAERVSSLAAVASRGVTAPATGTAGERVDANLARLRALQVVEVGALIVRQPSEGFRCYGPCPGDEPVVARLRAEAAERLERFVGLAERAEAAPSSDAEACAPRAVDANLTALRSLRVVEVDGLVVERPRNNPRCYNLPCEEDREAATRINCARAARLDAIVTATAGMR